MRELTGGGMWSKLREYLCVHSTNHAIPELLSSYRIQGLGAELWAEALA
jgi:hypothetical protein